MNNLKIVSGNLLDLAEDGMFNIVVHGCNCFHSMNSGIAKEIKERCPEAYKSDLKTFYGEKLKLGTYSTMLGKRFNIINAYTQYDFNVGDEAVDKFDYFAFGYILANLAKEYPGCNFGFPEIGCGRACGNKQAIYDMLEIFAEHISSRLGTVTVVQYDGSRR